MILNRVEHVRSYFVEQLHEQNFTIDKTGAKTIELIGASFIANESSIFGKPNQKYIDREIDWYLTQSTNINDIYRDERDPPEAWNYAANDHGEINSNYGQIIFSEKYYKQYHRVMEELRTNPDGRRATMVYNRPSIWTEYNENGKSDFICTNAVTYYVRGDRLHCVVQMRSNDVVFGYKNDYAWQKYLLNNMAYDISSHHTEIYAGDIMWQCQNLHVYERHFDLVK